MQPRSKPAIQPYKALTVFANAEITEDNWEEVLDRVLIRTDTWEPEPWVWLENPRYLDGKRIVGPEPLRIVQQELQEDFDRLTDPNKQMSPPILPSMKNPLPPYCPPPEARKHLRWLLEKIQGLLSTIPMKIDARRPPRDYNPHDLRVLMTDSLVFVPRFPDLRICVYFYLARCWRDGFLSRLGRCKRCQKFFVAPTQAKKIYCEKKCAQSIDAVGRVKASRERKATWEKKKQGLAQLLTDMQAIRQKRKLQRPRSERQVLE